MAAIRAGDVEWLVGADLSGFRKALDDAEAAVKGLGDKIGEQTQKYGLAFTAAGAAVTGAMGLMVKSAAVFESGMTKLSTLQIENQADMQRIEATVRSLATTYNTDLADGMEGAFTALSLFGTSTEGVTQAIQFMEANAKAATAGYARFSDIVGTATSIMSGFKVSGSEAADVLDKVSMAANISLLDVDDLSQVVGNMVPSFSGAKVSMEEMLAAVAVSTNINQNASEVATGLNNAIKAITKPAMEVRDKFDDLKITWGASALEGAGLAGWLEELKQKTAGNEQALMDLFPDMEAYRGIQILMTVGTEKLTEATEKVAGAHGIVAENLAKVLENDPTVQWGLLTKQLKDLAISIGQALLPALRSLTENLSPIVNSLRDWTRQHPELTANLVQGVAALGAFSLGLGTLLLAVKPLLVAVESLIFVFKAVPLALGLLTSPAAAAVAALASIGYAAYQLYQNWDEWWPMIRDTVAGTLKDITDLLLAGLDLIEGNWTGATERISKLWSDMWSAIKSVAGPAFEDIKQVFVVAGEFWSGWVTEVLGYFTNFKEMGAKLLSEAVAVISAPLDTLRGYLESFGGYLDSIIGHSTWIDYFENFETKGGTAFRNFERSVTDSLSGVVVPTFETFTKALENTNFVFDAFMGGLKRFDSIVPSIQGSAAVLRDTAGALHEVSVGSADANTNLLQAIDHLKAWSEVLGVSSSETGKAIREMREYIDTHKLTAEESTLATEEINRLAKELAAEEQQLNMARDATQGWTSATEDMGYAAQEAAQKVEGLYNGMLRGIRETGIMVSESISSFQAIYDAAVELTGSEANLMHGFWDELQRQQRRAIYGFEAHFRTLSEYIRDILGITEEGIQAHLDGLDKGVAYIKDTLSDTWIALSDDAEDNAAKVVAVIKSMSDRTGGSLRTVAKEAENAYKALAKVAGAGGVKGYASGGVTDHALVMVGERGPELAALPVGSRVMSHADMMAAASIGVRGYADGGVVDPGNAIDFKSPLFDRNAYARMVNDPDNWFNAKRHLQIALQFEWKDTDLDWLKKAGEGGDSLRKTMASIEESWRNTFGTDVSPEVRKGLDLLEAQAEAWDKVKQEALETANLTEKGLDALIEKYVGDNNTWKTVYARFDDIKKAQKDIQESTVIQTDLTWTQVREITSARASDVAAINSEMADHLLRTITGLGDQMTDFEKAWSASWKRISSETEKAGGVIQRTISSVVSGIKLGLSSLENFWGVAKGGPSGYAAGGVTDHSIVMVGERGPELAALPVGTRVLSHSDMMTAVTAGVRGYAGGGVVEPAYLTKLTEERLAYWEKFKKNLPPKAAPLTEMVQKELDKHKGNNRWTRDFLGQIQGVDYGAWDINQFASWLNAKVAIASHTGSYYPLGSTGGGNSRWNQGGGGGSGSGGGSGGWMPRTGNDLLDLGIFNFSERLGGLTAQAVSGGGGGQPGSSSTAVTISAPLVRVDRIDAHDQANVDKFLEKLTAAFLSRLSAAGLNLNGV